MLTNSSGTSYVFNEYKDFDQYGSFATPSKIMPYQSYPESLVNQMKSLLSYRVNELIWH